MANGSLSKTGFENVVNSSTSFLVNNNTTTYTPPTDNGIYDPIGAFYESKSAGKDPALSIANKTFRVLNSAGAGLTAAQVAALDTNADGKVSGVELNGLYAWSDSNEDGVGQTTELTILATALTNAGLSSVRSTDYGFYTAGNAGFKTQAQQIDFASTQIKINNSIESANANNWRCAA